jgi:uncharacterized membrane protein YgcG
MEQRPLRLGDLVDDYCPRERRITNHAVVAIVEEAIRQTRCTTCDAEHVFKGAKPPRRRKKDDELAPAPVTVVTAAVETTIEAPAVVMAADVAIIETTVVEASEPVREDEPAWFVHRPLIRAQLPKTNEEPPARPIPEFTMYQRSTRGSQQFRHGAGGRGGGGNGQEPNGNVANGNGGNGHSRGGGGGFRPHGRPQFGGGPGQPGSGPRHSGRRRSGKNRPR